MSALTNAFTSVSLVVDMGASSTGTFQQHEFNDSLEGCNQISLVGYYVDNLSVPAIFVSLRAPGVNCRKTLMSIKSGEYQFSGGGTGPTQQRVTAPHPHSQEGVVIWEVPAIAAGVATKLAIPKPLLTTDKNLGRLMKLEVGVRDINGDAVTYDRLILFFEATQLHLGANQLARYDQFPTSKAAQQSYNLW